VADAVTDAVRTVDGDEQPSVAVRVTAAMSDLDIGALFGEQVGRLAEHLAAAGVEPAGPVYARYHEFGPDRADIEFGIPVATPPTGLDPLDGAPAGEIVASVLPGGPLATTLHVGPYPELGQAYTRLEAWLAQHGRSGSGGPWESYVVMPGEVDGDPTRLRTELYWPLAPAG
jgi:effector-binding domain-containing protein